MKEFENDRNKDIKPKILGGLSISTGVLIILLWIISIPLLFIPRFTVSKTIIIVFFDIICFGIASFIDVSNKGLNNIKKRLFAKNIDAIKIKSLKVFLKANDTK